MAKQCHYRQQNRIEIMGAPLPPASLGAVPFSEAGQPSDWRHLALRHTGRSLQRRLSHGSASPSDYAFSYSALAAFCCHSPHIHAAIDCEALAATGPAQPMGHFLQRLGCQIGPNASASSIVRAWTVFEALAKYCGKGICNKIMDLNFSGIDRRSGGVDLPEGAVQWRSFAICGHWLTVAWPRATEAAIAITFLACPETLTE